MTEEHFFTIPEAAARLRIPPPGCRVPSCPPHRWPRTRLPAATATPTARGLPSNVIGGSYRVPIAALDRMADLARLRSPPRRRTPGIMRGSTAPDCRL